MGPHALDSAPHAKLAAAVCRSCGICETCKGAGVAWVPCCDGRDCPCRGQGGYAVDTCPGCNGLADASAKWAAYDAQRVSAPSSEPSPLPVRPTHPPAAPAA